MGTSTRKPYQNNTTLILFSKICHNTPVQDRKHLYKSSKIAPNVAASKIAKCVVEDHIHYLIKILNINYEKKLLYWHRVHRLRAAGIIYTTLGI